jgi:carbonic anhydrase
VVPEGEARVNRLIELTVKEQVINLAKTSIIQKAWSEDNRPHIHGWVYNLSDGVIKSVYDMEAGTKLDPVYEYQDYNG